jgi:hypothetical protein
VSSAAIAEIERRAKRLAEAKAAAKLAAEEFSAGEKLLPGTGKSEWRALFEAAREFARESHPHEIFPTLLKCLKPGIGAARRCRRATVFGAP